MKAVYEATINNGEILYETIRIEYETSETTLVELRGVVGQAVCVGPATAPPSFSGYEIYSATGAIVRVVGMPSEWMTLFREAMGKTSNITALYQHNKSVLGRIEAEASENENPRALQRVRELLSDLQSRLTV